jgi:lauroyl/myristoyl acyltransferase
VTASLESPDAAGPPAPRWYTHRLNRPGVHRAGAMLAVALPHASSLALARAVARHAADWFPAERARMRANVARVRSQASAPAREALVAEVFRHFAMSVLEAMIRRAPERWFNFFNFWSAAPAS